MKNLLLSAVLVTLPLLLGGCGGEKKESGAVVNPVEEKQQEFKEEVKTESSVTQVKPQLDGVNMDKLEEREGIVYLKGSDTPYTGKTFSFHENGEKAGEVNLKNGKREGLSLRWYENGQKKSEVNKKDGKPDGLATWWYKNGQKKMEANMKDGKPDGLTFGWHENGQKKMEANWKDGEEVEGSKKWWNRKGEPVDSREEAEAE